MKGEVQAQSIYPSIKDKAILGEKPKNENSWKNARKLKFMS
jgi:hypothetical protein